MSLNQCGIEELYQCWSFTTGATFEKIKLSENHTFLVTLDDQKWILRLTPKTHRNDKEIESELNFILSLAEAKDLFICTPIKLDNGTYIGSVSPYKPEESWWASLFVHAKGVSCANFNSLTDPCLIEEWGRTLGRVHNKIATLGWQIDENTSEQWKTALRSIPHYYETHGGAITEKRIEELASESECGKLVAEKWKALREKLSSYPKLNTNYGIIHSDLNMGNYFCEFDEGNKPIRLWVFDFDQSQLNWFGFDIAVCLFMSRFLGTHGWSGVKVEGLVLEDFEKTFLKGYTAEYQGMTLEDLELFVDFRELYMTSIALDLIHKIEHGHFFEQGIVGFVYSLRDNFPLKK